jgi:Dolichyl-phosphate-mannose-protein mannosyltransferase
MRGMEACLTQVEPTPAAAMPRSVALGPYWIRWAVAATIAVGLLWRALRYCEQFPIWGDEAMLLLNILERDYVGLTQHLRFNQVAPLFFLWLEKTAILLFGTSEWSVHLFPMLAGLIAFMLFWRTCRIAFTPMIAGLAVSILAVSYYPVRHACEVKPYAFDLCFAVVYLWMSLAHLRDRERNRWLIALIAVTPFAVFSSYPSVFVAGSVSLVLLPTMRHASWPQRGLYVLFNVLLLTSFVVHFGIIGHHQIDAAEAERTRDFLRTYWKDAFPPDDYWQWPIWLLKMHTGNMLAYPIGAQHGGSTLSFVLVLLGSVMLWRSGQRSLLALCWFPFALNLIAAILNKYPFGDSARITLHLAPLICILMAHGIAQVIDWIPSPASKTRAHLAVYVVLLACGIVGILRDVAKPFKTEHDRDVRLVARDIGQQIGANELVLLCADRDEDLLAELLWHLRARALPLRWQSTGVDADTQSYWLVECSHDEPGSAAPIAGWRIDHRESRLVPPENAKMQPVYCRWVRMVRE